MRIAVLQHSSPHDSGAVVADIAATALRAGADLVVCPAVSEGEAEAIGSALDRVFVASGGAYLLPAYDDSPSGSVSIVEIEAPFGTVGTTAVLVGDACFDAASWTRAREAGVVAAVLSPRCESELQAEAVLEVAIELSNSLCGLVIVAETSDGGFGEPGHGGSAIISLGKIVAEAFGETDIITADVTLPIPQSTPPEPLPDVPVILGQRLALHAGRRFDVDYPADHTYGGMPV
jgi:hypothetical protein